MIDREDRKRQRELDKEKMDLERQEAKLVCKSLSLIPGIFHVFQQKFV